MPGLFGLPNWAWRWIAIALVLLGAAATGAIKMHQYDERRYEELQGQFQGFKDHTALLGAQAKKAAYDQRASDVKRQKEANDENAATVAALQSRIDQLRKSRPGGSILSAAASCAGRPETAAVDRAQYQRAYGALVAELRALGDECTRAVTDLDTAKIWAQKKPDILRSP